MLFNETKSLQWTLPVLAGIAMLIARSEGFLTSFFFWHFQMGFHELGHTLAAWMGGQMAIPTYGFTLSMGDSDIFYVVLLVACALGIQKFQEGKFYFLTTILTLFAICALCLRLFGSPSFRQMSFGIGGFLGEIVLTTVIICGFYYDFPDSWRWDFFKYTLVFVALVVLLKSNHVWSQAKLSPGNLPMGGSVISETDKSDTERLLETGYWTGKTLPNFLVKTHQLSFFLIIGHYIFGLIAATPTKKSASIDHEQEENQAS